VPTRLRECASFSAWARRYAPLPTLHFFAILPRKQ
jgi:hypothetical protein